MTLALLSFLSTATGGYFYYSSSKEYAYRDAHKKADATIKIAASRIASELAEHQRVVRTLAGLKEIISAVEKRRDGISLDNANSLLDHYRSTTGDDVCYLMDRSGDTIASSNRNDPDSFVGENYAFRPYFTEAINGRPAVYMALGVTSKKRGIYFSHPVYRHGSDSAVGVVVIKALIEPIEDILRETNDGTLLLTGPHGVIFASSREEWLYHVLWEVSGKELNEIKESKQFGPGPWTWTGMKRTGPGRAADSRGCDCIVHEIKISHCPGWNVVYLWESKSVSDKFITPLLRTVGNIILALCFIIGLAVIILYKMASRDITARKKAEEQLAGSYEVLEARVMERTADLKNTNDQLRDEIEERTRVEEALVRSETEFKDLSQEFNALLNAIPDSLTLLSPDLKILWANQGAADSFGKDAGALKGVHCYTLWHKKTEVCGDCPAKRAFESGQIENEVIRTPDNRTWDLRAVPIKDEKGKVIKVIELGRDITEHRKLEGQLLHAQKMEAVGQLAGGVAHEFNNILTAIINNVYLVQRKTKEGDPSKDNLDKILRLSDNAAKIARELLAFSRKQLVNLAPLRLNEIVKGAERLLKNFIGEDIELRVKLTGKEPVIMADRHQIEQVIVNLATNARDAMSGGGRLTIETDVTKIDDKFVKAHGIGRPGTYALLSVSDTGEGISDDIKQKLFEPFFTTKEVGRGTGLGLSIVYGIITQHNGYINVYSEKGEGTTFKIFLPEIKSAVEEEKTAKPLVPAGKAETILLAEDEAEVRNAIRSVLEESGYSVIEAVDGKDALEKFMGNKNLIDLLVLDAIMPKMSGKEAYEKIREIRPGVKVIFISGYTAEIIRSKNIISEDLAFITKPIYPDDLLSKIREVMER